MTLNDCMLSCVVSGVRIGCDGQIYPTEECEHCGWNKKENERRKKLPLVKGADGLYRRLTVNPKADEPAPAKRKPAERGHRMEIIYTDPVTGEETVFASIKAAARSIGRSDVCLHYWLKGRSNVPESYNWRYAGDAQRPRNMSVRGYKRSVKFIDPETGEEKVYTNVKEAAQAAGVAYSTMAKWLRGEIPTPGHWRYADE